MFSDFMAQKKVIVEIFISVALYLKLFLIKLLENIFELKNTKKRGEMAFFYFKRFGV